MALGSAVIIGIGYLVAVAVFVWRQSRQAERLLQDLQTKSPDVWQELGAPKRIRDTLSDPERRWRAFVREGRYRLRCDPQLASDIDNFRWHTNVGLFLFAVVGSVMMYWLWPVLETASR